MAPILVERGQNFVERDIDECLWTSANLFVGVVADDPVDPGSEGRVTPERIDLRTKVQNASWTASSASCSLPVIRTARRYERSPYVATSRSAAVGSRRRNALTSRQSRSALAGVASGLGMTSTWACG